MTVGKAADSPASGKTMIRSKGLVKLSISDSQNQPKRISQLLTIAIKLLNVKLTKAIPEWCSAVLAPCPKNSSGQVRPSKLSRKLSYKNIDFLPTKMFSISDFWKICFQNQQLLNENGPTKSIFQWKTNFCYLHVFIISSARFLISLRIFGPKLLNVFCTELQIQIIIVNYYASTWRRSRMIWTFFHVQIKLCIPCKKFNFFITEVPII